MSDRGLRPCSAGQLPQASSETIPTMTSSVAGGSVAVSTSVSLMARGTGCCGPRLVALQERRGVRCTVPSRAVETVPDVMSAPGWGATPALPSSAVCCAVDTACSHPDVLSTLPSPKVRPGRHQRSSRPTGHPDQTAAVPAGSAPTSPASGDDTGLPVHPVDRAHRRQEHPGHRRGATTTSSPPTLTIHTVCGSARPSARRHHRLTARTAVCGRPAATATIVRATSMSSGGMISISPIARLSTHVSRVLAVRADLVVAAHQPPTIGPAPQQLHNLGTSDAASHAPGRSRRRAR